MSYNRWTESDYLAHHGVKGQVWGHKNGPPYPLSRQDKFRTVGPDGRPITSKVAYKKAQKNVRAANRAERKANPNGTPQDKKERGYIKDKPNCKENLSLLLQITAERLIFRKHDSKQIIQEEPSDLLIRGTVVQDKNRRYQGKNPPAFK